MAKRRLSQQQKQRIEAAQSAYRQSDHHQQGLVVSHQGGRILVELEPGILIDCKIKSNLGNIVCGDKVAIEAGTNQEHRVMAILPRENLLQRVDGFGQVRAVAAATKRRIRSVTPGKPSAASMAPAARRAGRTASVRVSEIESTQAGGSSPYSPQRPRTFSSMAGSTRATSGHGIIQSNNTGSSAR